MHGLAFGNLRLTVPIKSSISPELGRLALFSRGSALATGDGPIRADRDADSLLLGEPGTYLLMMQGALRSRAARDVTLRAVVAGDVRFAGPSALVEMAEREQFELLITRLNTLLGQRDQIRLPALVPSRSFSAFGVVSVPPGSCPTTVGVWGSYDANGIVMADAITVEFSAAELLAARISY